MTQKISTVTANFSDPDFAYSGIGINVRDDGSSNASKILLISTGSGPKLTVYKDGGLRLTSNVSAQNPDILDVDRKLRVKKFRTIANTDLTSTVYLHDTAFAEKYEHIQSNNGTVVINLNNATSFLVESTTNTITSLSFVKPTDSHESYDRTYSCLVMFRNVSVNASVWSTAGIVWLDCLAPTTNANTTFVNFYSSESLSQAGLNSLWFGMGGAGTFNGGGGYYDGGGGGGPIENYWITVLSPYNYLGEYFLPFKLGLSIDPVSKHIYYGGTTDDATSFTNVLKFDVDTGEVLWQKEFGENYYEDRQFYNLPVDNTGNVYAIYANGSDFEPPYTRAGLTKFNSDGTVLWQRAAYANTEVEPSNYNNYVPVGAITDTNNNIYVPLWIWYFGTGGHGIGFAKISSGGSLIESTVYETVQYPDPALPAFDLDIGLLAVAPTAITSNNEVVHARDFSVYNLNEYPKGTLILKTNSGSTSIAWSKAFFEPSGQNYSITAIATDSTGSIYVSFNTSGSSYIGVVVKLNNAGDAIFSKEFSDELIAYNGIAAMDVDSNDNLYVLDLLGNIYCFNSSGTLQWKNYLSLSLEDNNYFLEMHRLVVNKDTRNFLTISSQIYDNRGEEVMPLNFVCKLPRDGSIPGTGLYTVSGHIFSYEYRSATTATGVTSGSWSPSSFTSFYEDTGYLPDYGPLFDDTDTPVVDATYTDTTVLI